MQDEGNNYGEQDEDLYGDYTQDELGASGSFGSGMTRALGEATPGPSEFLERHITERRRLSKYDHLTGDELWPEKLPARVPDRGMAATLEVQELQQKISWVTDWLQAVSGELAPESQREARRLLRELQTEARGSSGRQSGGLPALRERGAAAEGTGAKAEIAAMAAAEAAAHLSEEEEDYGDLEGVPIDLSLS
ncbi:uncharacterized protein LOC143837240 [Paroedura picta]|uniref:uncharacterized protein LOC143837240 n=1 Tax=Paroedura picta TaxID=143630 RepID=UPI004057A54E